MIIVELKPMRALLDARAELSAKRHDFREAALRRIVRTLMMHSPQLCSETAQHMAVVLRHNMKTMKALESDHAGATSSRASAELRDMTRLYLASKLTN